VVTLDIQGVREIFPLFFLLIAAEKYTSLWSIQTPNSFHNKDGDSSSSKNLYMFG